MVKYSSAARPTSVTAARPVVAVKTSGSGPRNERPNANGNGAELVARQYRAGRPPSDAATLRSRMLLSAGSGAAVRARSGHQYARLLVGVRDAVSLEICIPKADDVDGLGRVHVRAWKVAYSGGHADRDLGNNLVWADQPPGADEPTLDSGAGPG